MSEASRRAESDYWRRVNRGLNPPRYGPLFTPAPFSDMDTSLEAAKSVEPHLERLEAVVLNAIRSQRPLGATDDELEALTGLRHQTCSARRRALVLRGLVRSMEITRVTRSGRRAKVWEEA